MNTDDHDNDGHKPEEEQLNSGVFESTARSDDSTDSDEEQIVYYNDVEDGTADSATSHGRITRFTRSQIIIWGMTFLGVMLLTMSAVFGLMMYFNVQYVKVYGSSMLPTFANGDGVFLTTREDDPQTDDIVVFVGPQEWSVDDAAIAETPGDEEAGDRHFIKRIVASPGDTVTLSQEGVEVNNEVYYQNSSDGIGNGVLPCFNTQKEEYQLGADDYFIMGDNYPHSTDAYAMYCLGADRENVLVDREAIAHFGDDVLTLPGGFAWFERNLEGQDSNE